MFCKNIPLHFGLLFLILASPALIAPGSTRAAVTVNGDNIPVMGEVTMVALGTDSNLPTRMLTPILAELKKVYQGRATIVSIDIQKESVKAKKFNALIVPTQIFFDRNNREVYRHGGVMDKATIVKRLDSLLADKG